jgi:alkanesulfonate monooxygenase SsuD/methylene tetrahydromethanopterin reductase-like flavin-dependent oxidoreductase (luciferase family)
MTDTIADPRVTDLSDKVAAFGRSRRDNDLEALARLFITLDRTIEAAKAVQAKIIETAATGRAIPASKFARLSTMVNGVAAA